MLHTNFHGHRPFGSREDDFFRFYHIWAWQPTWSSDIDHLIKLSFLHPMEAAHKIWLQSVKQFLRKKKWKCWIWVTLDQGQWMTLTFDIHIGSLTHLVICIYQLWCSRPTSAVLCPWARHFTPRKYWLITQEAMAPSRHDWKIVDWDVKPQHNQPTNFDIIDYNNFWKNPLFDLFPMQKHKGPNLTFL